MVVGVVHPVPVGLDEEAREDAADPVAARVVREDRVVVRVAPAGVRVAPEVGREVREVGRVVRVAPAVRVARAADGVLAVVAEADPAAGVDPRRVPGEPDRRSSLTRDQGAGARPALAGRAGAAAWPRVLAISQARRVRPRTNCRSRRCPKRSGC